MTMIYYAVQPANIWLSVTLSLPCVRRSLSVRNKMNRYVKPIQFVFQIKSNVVWQFGCWKKCVF